MLHDLPKQWLRCVMEVDQVNRPPGAFGQGFDEGDFFFGSQRVAGRYGNIQIAVNTLPACGYRAKYEHEFHRRKMRKHFPELGVDGEFFGGVHRFA